MSIRKLDHLSYYDQANFIMKALADHQLSIYTIPYSENLRDAWDDFIEHRALNSTFLHSRGFFDSNPSNAQEDASLVFYKNKKIIALFPAVLYTNDNGRILNSHLRATYGGFIVCEKLGVEDAIVLIKQLLLYAKQQNVDQILIRNPFRIFHSQLCDETDYAMWYCGFQIKSRELEIAIPLNGKIEAIKSHYHQNTARNVRKAISQVQVAISNDFAEYWTLLEKCLLLQHGKKPTHDYSSIVKLKSSVVDKVFLFGAYYNCQLIGGIVLFDCNKLVVHAQYIASDPEFKHLCPVHAVIDCIIDWGHDRGVKYLSLGMANEDEGRSINHGLFRFKESFGGRGVLRETMYIDL